MKLLVVLLGFTALLGLCWALPQLVGIVDEETLKYMDKLNAQTGVYWDEAPVQSGNGDVAGCDYANFYKLFTQFTVDAKFPAGTNYTNNGEALKAAVNGIFNNLDATDQTGAQSSLDAFCIAQRNFFNNVGVQQIEACVTPSSFAGNGYTRTNSYQTMQVLSQINFQCGPAFTTYTTNIQQYLTARSNFTDAFSTCATDFITNLSGNETDHGCGALTIYDDCLSMIYYQATQSVDLGWTTCEASRRVNVLTLPVCNDQRSFCDISIFHP